MPVRPITWPLVLVLIVLLVVTLFPIFWIAMTAIKPPADWNAAPRHAFCIFEQVYFSRPDRPGFATTASAVSASPQRRQ